MTIFEPLFLLLSLVTVAALVTAGVLAARARFARARTIVLRVSVGAGCYFAIAILVSVASPRRTFRVGDPQCFDDWCIAVTGARWPSAPPDRRFEVAFRLSNRARRRPMGEKGTVAYVTDGQGRRYDPLPDPMDAPFDTILQPGQSIDTKRRFDVPRDAADLDLVYTHEGGFPIWWLIIGESGWFQKPPAVRLTAP